MQKDANPLHPLQAPYPAGMERLTGAICKKYTIFFRKCNHALARAYAEQNGKHFTREDGLRRYQEQARMLGMDPNRAEEGQVEVGVMQCCISYYKQAILDSCADHFQVVLVP